MAIHKIKSRTELIEYALRKLGAPVVNIELDIEQLEDSINDALNLFYEYHMEGSEREFITIPITQENIDTGTFILPEEIFTVVSCRFMHSSYLGFNLTTNLQHQAYMSDIISKTYTANSDGIVNYTVVQSYLGTLEHIFSTDNRTVSFNKYGRKLKINTNWNQSKAGQVLGLEVYRIMDADQYPEVYDNYWLKKYVSALAMKQWGINLIKFGNIQLMGGGTTQGDQILMQANNDLEKLEDQLRNEFTYLPMGFMG